jgi:hypothetical protein
LTNLPITSLPPASRETVYSYLSRLAATWRTEVADLAYDMGAPFKRFLEQDPEAFVALAAWADLGPGRMEELL